MFADLRILVFRQEDTLKHPSSNDVQPPSPESCLTLALAFCDALRAGNGIESVLDSLGVVWQLTSHGVPSLHALQQYWPERLSCLI